MGDIDNNPPQSLAEILQNRLVEQPIESPKPVNYRQPLRSAILAGVLVAILLAIIITVQ